MGLDQYLWKSKDINVYDFNKDECIAKKIKVKVDVEFVDGEIKTKEYELDNPKHSGHVYLPVAYWRKANCIHRWILEHTVGIDEDKCQKIYLYGSKIKELVETCKEVLADHNKAKDLLPVMEGFFFGSYEYDKWYFEDLENTIKQLEKVDFDGDFIYQASW